MDAKLLQAPGDIVLAPAGQPTVEIRDMAGKPVPGLAVACFCSPLTRIPSGAGLPGAVPGGFEVAITDDLGRVTFQHADPSRKYWIEFADRSLIVQSGDHVLPPTRSDAVILCPLGVARAMVSVVRFAPDVPDQIRVREAWWTYRLTIGGGTLFRLQRALYQEYPGCSALVALAKDVSTTSEQVQVGLKGQTHPRWTEQHMTFVRPPDVDGERLVPMEVCFEDVALVDDAWLGIQIVDADGTGCHGLDLLVSSVPRPDTVVPMRSGEHRRSGPEPAASCRARNGEHAWTLHPTGAAQLSKRSSCSPQGNTGRSNGS